MMKRFSCLILIAALLVISCAHNSNRTYSAKPADASPTAENKTGSEDEYLNDINDEEVITIADPLEPFNRAMYVFNDKLYFWMLKPVAQGYSKVVPEPARISVK